MTSHSTLVRRTYGRNPTVSAECSCTWSSGTSILSTPAADAEIKQAEEDHRKEVGL